MNKEAAVATQIKELEPSVRQTTVTQNLPQSVARILMAGSSGVGKSTVMEGLDQHSVRLVPRFTTIPKRRDSIPWENIHVSAERFQKLQGAELVELVWSRELEKDTVVKYGFPPISTDGRLPIYSTNNAFFEKLAEIPEEFLEGSLIVGVFAPNIIREARLVQRSPDMPPKERVNRLSDDPRSVFDMAHVVINNYGYFEDGSSDDLMRLIDLII